MTAGDVDFDAVLDLCRDGHRRIVLAVLAAERRPLTLNDLTKTILRFNHETPVTEVSEAVIRRIRLSLNHDHIPRLEAAGLVEYDPKRQLVEPTDRFDRLQPHLSAVVALDPDLELPIEM